MNDIIYDEGGYMMYNYPNYNLNDYTMPSTKQDDYSMLRPASNIANSYDGFIRGNMFTDLYQPYIASEPFNLSAQNERDNMLNKFREYNFATLDLGLYLDTHPDDAEKIKAFNQFRLQADQAKVEYERKYGPLSLNSDTLNSYPWAWIMSPWPWEVM